MDNAGRFLLDSDQRSPAETAGFDWFGQRNPQAVSRDQLVDKANSTALRLAEGVPPNERIAIVATPSVSFVQELLGAMLANRSAVVLDPRIPFPHQAFWSELGVRHFFDQRSEWQRGDWQLTGSPIDGPVPDEAVVLFTSGTSGTARPVRLSHRNLIHNVQATAKTFSDLAASPDDGPMSLAVNAAHAYGLSLLGLALLRGIPVVLHRYPQFIGSLIDDMNACRVTTFPSVSSHLAMEFESDSLVDQRSVPTLQRRWFAGEAASSDLIDHLRPLIPNGELCQLYGMTEHTARVSIKRIENDFKSEQVGRILDGVEVNIANVDQEEEFGEITLRSDSVCMGYIGSPLAKTPSGFLHTGDFGVVNPDGDLIVKGRVSNHGNYKAHSFWLTDIEAEISQSEGVIDCIVRQPGEGQPLECEIVISSQARFETLRDSIVENCWPAGLISRVTAVDRIKRTLSGKKERH